jgi:hypothetical protein
MHDTVLHLAPLWAHSWLDVFAACRCPWLCSFMKQCWCFCQVELTGGAIGQRVSAWASMTECHGEQLRQQTLVSRGSGGWIKIKIKAPANSASCEGSLDPRGAGLSLHPHLMGMHGSLSLGFNPSAGSTLLTSSPRKALLIPSPGVRS